MKKIYLPMMLAASFGIANATPMPTYTGNCNIDGYDHSTICGIPPWIHVYGSPLGVSTDHACTDYQFFHGYDGYTPGLGKPYVIHNNKSQSINGFKLYYYFTAPPSRQFNVKVYRYLYADRNDRGRVMVDNSIQPNSIQIENLSETQHRAVLDYSNVSIAKSSRFPAQGGIYIRVASTDSYGIDGYELNGFVIGSKSGTVLYGPDLNDEGTTTLPLTARRIGVLTDESTCPDYSMISLDVEDSNDQTSITHVGGASGSPIGVQKAGSYLRFKYCGLSYSRLPQARFGYAVLKLDSECPAGSVPIIRTHDTEDSNNNDSYTGYIWPNSVVKGPAHTVLQYCFVSSKAGSSIKYPFEKKYGVFASNRAYYGDENNISVSKVFVDDENNGNQNSWDRSGVPLHLRSLTQDVMTGYEDTEYYVARWVGPENAMLSKSAEVADVHHSVNNSYVAAAPLAPAIKGLNRSAVAVELQSAGDAKISIVGINGAVVANITEKNLQPGVHQIKWNAGMVPSGRYVVKIEQNGMVNAKNVILK
ncbi:hypothetical protein SAMN05720759_10893 [Fibrobacter sp. UWB12]|nr:hypothetical protein SAMN05720759_10893 [Fibrobacter sp. UWB12]